LTPLRLHDIRQAQLVVVVSKNRTGLTLNLKAPIVINLEERTGRQVVASGDLSMQHLLDPNLTALKKSA
jgi:flagellar assembly factor FliW